MRFGILTLLFTGCATADFRLAFIRPYECRERHTGFHTIVHGSDIVDATFRARRSFYAGGIRHPLVRCEETNE